MDYVNFLKSYGGLILAVLTVVLSIISLILRKKKIVVEDSLLNGIYSFAVELINLAETKFKIGSDKKKFVIEALKEKFPQYTKVLDENLKAACSNYYFTEGHPSDDVFGVIVESILSTPSKKKKKEVANEKTYEKVS